MRIICVEEHTADPGLMRAGQPRMQSQAPYFTEVGALFKGNVADGDDKLPMQLAFQISGKLLSDTGTGRIEEMDKHRIDMQILSCSPSAGTRALLRRARHPGDGEVVAFRLGMAQRGRYPVAANDAVEEVRSVQKAAGN